MFLGKLIILFSTFSFEMGEGEKKWMTLPMAESYEYQVVGGEGAMTLAEYQKMFLEKGLLVEHLEISREILSFRSREEILDWIEKEMAPRLGKEGDSLFVGDYFERLEKMGWMPSESGVFRFPREQLLVCLRKG